MIELCLVPGLSSASPRNKSKTLYNHVATHNFMTITKKERAFEFLVPLQVLCFMTRNTVRNNTLVKKHCYGKKSNAQKYYCDNDFAKTNYDILIHEQSVDS